MARAVVLLFEDNEACEAWVEESQENDGRFMVGGGEDGPTHQGSFKVVGLYPIPTMICTCDAPPGGKRIVRGAKLGWWVHNTCGKPVSNSYQAPKNLVDPDWTYKQEPTVLFRGQVAFKYGMGKLPDAPT